jgi:type IV secretion system protein TrbL
VSSGPSCPLPLSPLCEVGSGVGSLVGGATGSLANDVLTAVVGWILKGADWLLQHIGSAVTSTTSVHVSAPWFESHYAAMGSIAAVVAVPMLLLAAVQAVFQQSPSLLLRAAFIQLPLAGLLTAVAVQIVQLSLTATDELCTMVSSGSGGDISKVLARIGTTLVTMGVGPMPGFVVTVGALLVVAGGFVLWLELLVRAAAVYAAVLFLPLALASLVWPAVSHWCRRLVDTIAALILSKFVVVAVLSLAVGALGTGRGFNSVLAGGALLLLAAFTPFTLLRLLPMIEVGAAMQLEGARHRVRQAVTSMPSGAASFALGKAREQMVPPMEPGEVGSGTDPDPGVAGSSEGTSGAAGGGWDDAGDGSGVSGLPGLGGPGGDGPGAGGPGGLGGVVAGMAAGEAAAVGGAAAELTPEMDPLSVLPRGERESALRPPPGGIPLWQGDPVATMRALESLKEFEKTQPDGAGGGAIPGVESPLWGGNEPRNRFVPGPTDRWEGWPTPGAGGGGEERDHLWSPADEPDDSDVPSEYFFD